MVPVLEFILVSSALLIFVSEGLKEYAEKE